MRYQNKQYRRVFSNRPARRIKAFDPSGVVGRQAEYKKVEIPQYTTKYKFADFDLAGKLAQNIAGRNYPGLTPIQDQAIPLLLSGRDVVGLANTGTGKTAAFLIPLINKIASNRSQRVLIIAPTRELAVQIEQEMRIFSAHMGIYSALCIGGVGLSGQIFRLKRNPNFVIGTPGRLKDLGNQKAINFASFGNLVLDEVDRMLDMGFIHDITYLLNLLPKARQTAFFSATTNYEVEKIMRSHLNNPVTVSVNAKNNLANITQRMVKVNGKPKVEVLHNLLIEPGFDKVLVFGRTKHGLDKLAKELGSRGFLVAAIHGNKSQPQRQRSLELFKNNQVKVLLATDVASRGLDINNVTHVINYDLPETADDYTHRIGRTGRANKTGVALTLID